LILVNQKLGIVASAIIAFEEKNCFCKVETNM